MIKAYLILIIITVLFNYPIYSAEVKTDKSTVGTGGSEDYTHLKSKNNNLIKAEYAIKQAKKYDKKKNLNKAKKRFEDAIKFLTLANEERPNDPDILGYLGYSFRKVDDFTMAEIYYEQGLEINPYHIGINRYLGELYFQTNRVNKVRERLKVLEKCNCKEYKELENLISKY